MRGETTTTENSLTSHMYGVAQKLSSITIDEYRVDALLMAIEDNDPLVDRHEPRSLEVAEYRVDALLLALEVSHDS